MIPPEQPDAERIGAHRGHIAADPDMGDGQ